MQKIRLTSGDVIDREFFKKYRAALKLFAEQPYAQELFASLDALVKGKVQDVILKMKGNVKLPILMDYKTEAFKQLFKASFFQVAGVYIFQEPAPVCILADNSEFLCQDADEIAEALTKLGNSNLELLKKLRMGTLKANDLHIFGKLGLTDSKNKLLQEVAKFVSVQLLIEGDDFTILPTLNPLNH